MAWIEVIIKFFTDRTNRLSHKAAVIIIIIGGLFLIDDFFNFSYSYRTSKKIEQIEKLSSLIKDTTLDKETKDYAIVLRKNVIAKKTVLGHLSDFFTKSSDNAHKRPAPAIATNNDSNKPNDLLWFLSQTLFFFIIGLLVAIANYTTSKEVDKTPIFVSSVAGFCIIVVVGILTSYAYDYIPPLSKTTWKYNYFLNFGIQLVVVSLLSFLFYKFVQYSIKKEKEG